ncbi:MAG: TM2 domain-containing protein [Planctomycetaceae bacterium]|nr:TM2 domain-containing protein [Planctomycetaceae bacterium]MCA9034856.1 TM2 domain-containing protein [Planctomycetaceae bacterium]
MNATQSSNHSLIVGYLCWVFGFMGAHRFYYGKQVTGTIWFFTLGLLGIGWLVDLFLMPSLHRSAERRYHSGVMDYNVAWLLLTFLGIFGVHRLYLGKWVTGILWFLTGGLFLLGWLYDLWTLNEQVSEENSRMPRPGSSFSWT